MQALLLKLFEVEGQRVEDPWWLCSHTTFLTSRAMEAMISCITSYVPKCSPSCVCFKRWMLNGLMGYAHIEQGRFATNWWGSPNEIWKAMENSEQLNYKRSPFPWPKYERRQVQWILKCLFKWYVDAHVPRESLVPTKIAYPQVL